MIDSSKREIELLTGTRTEYEDHFQDFKRKRQQTIEQSCKYFYFYFVLETKIMPL